MRARLESALPKESLDLIAADAEAAEWAMPFAMPIRATRSEEIVGTSGVEEPARPYRRISGPVALQALQSAIGEVAQFGLQHIPGRMSPDCYTAEFMDDSDSFARRDQISG